MKRMLLLILLTLPAFAQSALSGDGTVSIDVSLQSPPRTVVLEARDTAEESWRCLNTWELGPLQSSGGYLHLETPPGQTSHQQYRVLTFDLLGYQRSWELTPPATAMLGQAP